MKMIVMHYDDSSHQSAFSSANIIGDIVDGAAKGIEDALFELYIDGVTFR
jgi:hypothetical protein